MQGEVLSELFWAFCYLSNLWDFIMCVCTHIQVTPLLICFRNTEMDFRVIWSIFSSVTKIFIIYNERIIKIKLFNLLLLSVDLLCPPVFTQGKQDESTCIMREERWFLFFYFFFLRQNNTKIHLLKFA